MWLGSSFTVSESGELATLAEFVWKAASPAKRGKQPIYPDTKATDFNLTRPNLFHTCARLIIQTSAGKAIAYRQGSWTQHDTSLCLYIAVVGVALAYKGWGVFGKFSTNIRNPHAAVKINIMLSRHLTIAYGVLLNIGSRLAKAWCFVGSPAPLYHSTRVTGSNLTIQLRSSKFCIRTVLSCQSSGP